MCDGKSAISVIQSENNIKGFVHFHQCSQNEPVFVYFHLHGFRPNQTHAIHIHEFGDLTDGCKSLGPHYNPQNTVHGSMKYPQYPRHSGDLINNLTSNKNGNFEFSYEDELLTLYGEQTILGRSVVIHEGIDDLGRGTGNKEKESKITGNAGNRIACSIIGLAKNQHL